MLVLYGSQTGNAEDVAERIGRKLRLYGLSTTVLSLELFDALQLSSESFILFVCSTTGQGENPDNMKVFWRSMLRKSLSNDILRNLRFCVIGLGDSSYDLYNIVAKKLSKRLKQLGAKEIEPLLLCDDQHELGYDAALQPWLDEVPRKILNDYFDIKLENSIVNESLLLPPKYSLCFHDESKLITEESITTEHYWKHCTTVKSNIRITSLDHFQAVHHIIFAIDSEVKYEPGDVALFMPHNDSNNVDEFLKLWPNEKFDEEFVLKSNDPNMPLPKNLPKPCTLRNCAHTFWDIQSVPRRSFFDLLWHFSTSDIEQEKLKEFTTAEGQEELYSYCNRPKRNILEVLQDFPHTTPNIPMDYLFDLIPHIRPRSFSIASSLSYCKNELHVLVAVVHYATRLQKPRTGLCSTWLSQLKVSNEVIPYSLKHGSIALPVSELPIIMVGPGTGCAPFRGFIQHQVLKQRDRNFFFFGCRYKNKDFLCDKEWISFVHQDFLKLYVAYSRDQEHKIYVQDKMLEESSVLWDLIHRKSAYVYISGNSKMPSDVKIVLLKIFEKEGNIDQEACKMYLRQLEAKKRLQIEAWS